MEASLYTRGGADDPDTRGPSLVQQRAELLQKEKEDAALQQIAQIMPELGTKTHILALTEHGWNVEAAAVMLKLFKADQADKLAAIHKKRKKALEDAAAAAAAAADIPEELPAAAAAGKASRKKPKHSPSSSPSSSQPSSSSESSDDDSSEDERRRKSKSKRSKRSKSKDRSKSKKHSSKEKKKHKKERRSSKRKRRRGDASSDEGSSDDDDDDARAKAKQLSLKDMTNPKDFGKYGLLKEADISSKWGEFSLWAREVRGVDLETVGRVDERDLFKSYMEDYNTGTMPHRKYYDVAAYERERARKAAQKAAKRGRGRQQRTARDDEEELRRERAAERAQQAKERLAQAYDEIRSGKAEDMRQQELLRAQMALAYRTGDAAKAQKLQQLLLPDHLRKEDDKVGPPKL